MTTEEAFWDKLSTTLTELSLHEAQQPLAINHAFDKMDAKAGKDYLLAEQKSTARKLEDVKASVQKLRTYLAGPKGA